MHARLLVIYLGILNGYISEVLHTASGKGLLHLHICLQHISNAARGLDYRYEMITFVITSVAY